MDSDRSAPVFPPGQPQSIRLRTEDGIELPADLVVAEQAWAGAVVAHPHPAYGGDRHNPVVEAIFRALATAGMTVLRFDFRSSGHAGAGGHGGAGEQHDVLAAVERAAQHLEPGVPLWLTGYSFGADIALSVDDPRVTGWVAVAPPLRFGPAPRASAGDPRPVLAVAAEHDQFNPPGHLHQATAGWPDATVCVIPGADHFLAGAAGNVASTVLDWIRDSSHR